MLISVKLIPFLNETFSLDVAGKNCFIGQITKIGLIDGYDVETLKLVIRSLPSEDCAVWLQQLLLLLLTGES